MEKTIYKEAIRIKIVGIGLCLIGIGIIANAFTMRSGIPKWTPKGRPAGEYDPDDDWEFPED